MQNVLELFREQRGQLSVSNFLNLFVLGIIIFSMLPILIIFINAAIANVDPLTASIIAISPVVLVIAYLKSIDTASQPFQRFIRGE